MDQDMITDITLDHLPDLSEVSVSFQIPPDNASADLLLTDHTDGFDLLCNAIDDDTSFAPVELIHPRGPLTLGELTPRVQVASRSPRRTRTPIVVPSSSAKPSLIQRPLTLGHRSPDKPRKPPSHSKSVHRQLESPLVSSERFLQLREEIETLGQADESPSHVRAHVMASTEDGSVECSTSSHANLEMKSDALENLPASEDLLVPIPEEKDTSWNAEQPADEDVAMATSDSCPANVTNVVVPTPSPKSKRFPRTNTRHTVVAGGISKRTAHPTARVSKKTKDKTSRVREAHQPPAVRQGPRLQSINAEGELVPPACMGGNTESKPENTQIAHSNTGGLAERLVSYSQKLISSIGLYKPKPESSFVEASDDAVRVADSCIETRPSAAVTPPALPPRHINDLFGDHSEPFRLSEISPPKLPPSYPKPSSPAYTETPQDGGLHTVSPMRAAKKRVSIDTDRLPECHRHKRAKTVRTSTDPGRGSLNEAVSQGQPCPAKTTHGRGDQSAAQHPDSSKSTLPSARTKYRPKLSSSQCKGPTLDAFPYVSGSRQVHERMNKGRSKRDGRQSKAASVRSKSSLSGFSASSRLRQDKETKRENVTESAHVYQRSGPTSTADLPLIEKKPNAALPVAQLTKPVGFTFRVDARLEARKAEERLAVSEPGKTQSLYSVPDVRAHEASHRAAFKFHREGVVPIHPVVPFFYTEQRAKEREKFDEMVKRKAEEMVRLKEEQRQREAEEEERAIRELRRKAIPKANEIPEWYADMPKRKGAAV